MHTPHPIMLEGGLTIGGDRVFIIAEIGANHAQNLKVALESIDIAAELGADAVKFQSLNLNELYHEPSREIRSLHAKIDLPEEWYPVLRERCDKRGITFTSSPTYLRSIDLLEQQDVEIYKLASAQVAVFPQLVQKVAMLGKPVVLSTGLVTEEELGRVVSIFKAVGNDNFVILHCNSVYPASPEIVHLPRMMEYRERFRCAVGFSDHTESNAASIAAVANGASVIERHFTISRELDSPDAPFALEPKEFGEFIEAVREAESICRVSPRSFLEPDEECFRDGIIHSLLAAVDIRPGDEISMSNVRFMRGTRGVGIDARNYWNGGVVQSVLANTQIKKGEWITESKVTRAGGTQHSG